MTTTAARRRLLYPAVLTALVLSTAAACPNQASDPGTADTRSFRDCQAQREGTQFDEPSVTISDTDRQPRLFNQLTPNGTLLVVSDPAGRIDTSPGQVLLPNLEWGAAGNGKPAPADWLVPGASEFSVVVQVGGRPFPVGMTSACIPAPAGAADGIPLSVGLNVVQQGWASPLTNKWKGSIGVRLVIFPA